MSVLGIHLSFARLVITRNHLKKMTEVTLDSKPVRSEPLGAAYSGVAYFHFSNRNYLPAQPTLVPVEGKQTSEQARQ